MTTRFPYLMLLLTLLFFSGCGYTVGEQHYQFTIISSGQASLQQDRSREDVGLMFRDALKSDQAPSSFQRNTRTYTPVNRINPYFKWGYGIVYQLRKESERCRFREERQARLTAFVQSIHDFEGYYIYDLRKIII